MEQSLDPEEQRIADASFWALADEDAFDELLSAWNDRITRHASGALAEIVSPDLSTKLKKIDRLARKTQRSEDMETASALVTNANVPAFATDRNSRLVAINALASEVFMLKSGDRLDLQLFEAASQPDLNRVRKSLDDTGSALHAIVRMQSVDDTVIPAECFVVHDANTDDAFMVVRSLETGCPDEFDLVLGSAFGLTAAEASICRLLLKECDTKRVAEMRGATVLTVRTQLRSIFGKTGTTSQVALVRLLSNLVSRLEGTSSGRRLRWTDSSATVLAVEDDDGVRIGYSVLGDPNGTPVVLMHNSALGYLLANSTLEAIRQAGICLIAPSRPGFGNSDRMPHLSALDGSIRALDVLFRKLDLQSVPVVALGTGAIPAIGLASQTTDRISRILILGGCAPLNSSEDLKRLPMNQRTFFWLSRHTPWIAEQIALKGIRTAKNKGAAWYLDRVFSESEIDRETLKQPEVSGRIETAVSHLFGQGQSAFLSDIQMMSSNWEPMLGQCTIPIDIMYGLLEQNFRPDHIEAFASRHNQVRCLPLEGVGELLQFQAADQITEAICDLVRPGII